MGTSTWPPAGTYSRPPVGTFSWPRTAAVAAEGSPGCCSVRLSPGSFNTAAVRSWWFTPRCRIVDAANVHIGPHACPAGAMVWAGGCAVCNKRALDQGTAVTAMAAICAVASELCACRRPIRPAAGVGGQSQRNSMSVALLRVRTAEARSRSADRVQQASRTTETPSASCPQAPTGSRRPIASRAETEDPIGGRAPPATSGDAHRYFVAGSGTADLQSRD
jgi:hypothetical protein